MEVKIHTFLNLSGGGVWSPSFSCFVSSEGNPGTGRMGRPENVSGHISKEKKIPAAVRHKTLAIK
jgi:hypothetical protein